jgi:hypothetical protein
MFGPPWKRGVAFDDVWFMVRMSLEETLGILAALCSPAEVVIVKVAIKSPVEGLVRPAVWE